MTTVQVYDGDGPTPEIMLDQVTEIIAKTYPDLFPPDVVPELKAQVLFAINDIRHQRHKQIATEALKDKITQANTEAVDDAMTQGLEPDEFAERLIGRLQKNLQLQQEQPRPGVLDWSQTEEGTDLV